MKMKCEKCGKDLKEGWNRCPYCGKQMEKSERIENIDKHNFEPELKITEEKKKSRKKNKSVIVACAILAIVIMMRIKSEGSDTTISKDEKLVQEDSGEEFVLEEITSKSMSDVSDRELIEVAKHSYLNPYNIVLLNDMLEYNWPGGKWETGRRWGSGSGYEIARLRYTVEDQNRSFEIDINDYDWKMEVAIVKDGDIVATDDASNPGVTSLTMVLDQMYSRYYENNEPLEGVDFAEYIDSDIQNLLDTGKIFEDTFYRDNYYCMGGCCNLEACEGKIEKLEMSEGVFCGMSFSGMQVGDYVNEEKLAEAEYVFWGNVENYSGGIPVKVYKKIDKEECVLFVVDTNERITRIEWIGNLTSRMLDVNSYFGGYRVTGGMYQDDLESVLEEDVSEGVLEESGVTDWGNYTCYYRDDGLGFTLYPIDDTRCYLAFGNPDDTIDVRDVEIVLLDYETALHTENNGSLLTFAFDWENGYVTIYQTGYLQYCDGIDFSGQYKGGEE